MKHQQVSVDYWAMLKSMFLYGMLAALVWLMLRLFNTAFMLPGRLRAHHQNIQDTLDELKRRFPDLNITEEELKNAEKEYEDLINEVEENSNTKSAAKSIDQPLESQSDENKKTL